MPITRNNIRLKHQLFTSNGTWVVPDGVNVIWVDAAAGGGGGAGGYYSGTPGGGGGGGSAGENCSFLQLPVTPGETVTLGIGSGGAGGAVNASGVYGGSTTITASLFDVLLSKNTSGLVGTATLGGTGGGILYNGGSGYSNGGAGAGPNTLNTLIGPLAVITGYGGYAFQKSGCISAATAGGAPTFNGGNGWQQVTKTAMSNNTLSGGTGGANGGGGGCGGSGLYGTGGVGGSNGAAGGNASGYGAGGGGGSGNFSGGAGSPGFVRIYWED